MSLLKMSMMGGVVIGVIVLLRALLGGRLPRLALGWLWLVALARLMLPFQVPSSLSVYSVASRLPVASNAPLYEPVRRFAQAVSPAPLAVQLPVEPLLRALQGAAEPIAPSATAVSERIAPVAAPLAINWWLVIYIIGALAVALYLAVACVHLWRVACGARRLEAGFACEFVRGQRMFRGVGVYASGTIASPFTFGFLRPRIMLPEGMLGDERRLHYVLSHEMIHIRRFDAPVKLLFALCLCAHWFNPLVWVMYMLYNRDVELSCDERVLRVTGADSRREYARLLLAIEQGGAPAPFASAFSRYSLKERIVAIMKYKHTSALAVALALLMVVLVAGAFATSAVPVREPIEGIAIQTDGTPVNGELPLVQRALNLMTPGYEQMTLAQFEQAVRDAFPASEPPLFESWAWYEHAWDDPAQYAFLTGAYQNTAMDIYFENGNPILHLGLRQGAHRAHEIDHVPLPVSPQRPFAQVYYQLTYQVNDKGAVTVGERERMMNEYYAAMDAYIRSLSEAQLFEFDPIPGLRVERDRISARIGGEHIKLRAVDIGWIFNYDDTSYSSPRNFFDNMEGAPLQREWSGAMIDYPAVIDKRAGVQFGVDPQTGEGMVSINDGYYWYANGYRDPVSGVSFRYLPESGQAQISPDNGRTWWSNSADGYYYICDEYPTLLIECMGPDEWCYLSTGPGDWDFPQAPYET